MDAKTKTSGVISYHEMYTLSEFKKRMGLTDTAMREMRRKGFSVIRVGKRAFVLGVAAITFFAKEWAEADESESTKNPLPIFGDAVDLPANRKGKTEVSQDKRSA